MLNSAELTGRAATHVRRSSELNATLDPRAAEAAIAMRAAAREAGIELEIASGFRDFERQVAIWNGKFSGTRPLLDKTGQRLAVASLDAAATIDAILIWSALPGASRHHWGTEIDVIDAACVREGTRPRLEQAEFAEGGCFEKLAGWLPDNMEKFGFFRPYRTDRGGVQPEPWHLSHAEGAGVALSGMSVEILREAVMTADGLLGRQMVLERLPDLYARYVVSIDERYPRQSCSVAQTRLM